jgi:hypothetical protein
MSTTVTGLAEGRDRHGGRRVERRIVVAGL